MANPFDTKDQVVGGAFTAADCTLDLGDKVNKAIIQRVQFSIERPINLIYEISAPSDQNNYVYYVGGRRRGQATFERIVGGSGTFRTFVENYGNLCANKGENIVLTAKGGCKIDENGLAAGAQGGGVKYTLKTPKIQALGASVAAQDIVIMETATMMFLDLDYTEA